MLIDQYCSSADDQKQLAVPSGTKLETIKITPQDAQDPSYAPDAKFKLLRRALDVKSGMDLLVADADDILNQIAAKGYAKYGFIWEIHILSS